MSLINDALKRASQSERARPRDPGLPSVMQPAIESRRSIFPVVAGVFILALLAAAGWLVWRALPNSAIPATAPILIAVKPTVPAPPPKTEPAPAPAPVPAPAVVTPPDNNPPVSPPPAPPPAPAVVPEALPFPDLKLQGIFYNRTNPKAAINGQIHAENELVGEVRIVKIAQNKVTVEWNGQMKDLSLGGD